MDQPPSSLIPLSSSFSLASSRGLGAELETSPTGGISCNFLKIILIWDLLSDLLLITTNKMPSSIKSTHGGIAVRQIAESEAISIEDYFFKEGKKQSVPLTANVVQFSNAQLTPTAIEELRILTEFGLSLLTHSGHPTFRLWACFTHATCSSAGAIPPYHIAPPEPRFIETLKGAASAQWLKACNDAKKQLKERFHITAARYVKYAKSNNDPDALLDLSISLESLLDSQTEIAFRFGVCLTKLLNEKGASARSLADLLSDLYNLRSKLAHGDPGAEKAYAKLEPRFGDLRATARRVLVVYVLHANSHT